jgi:hypothetical protein
MKLLKTILASCLAFALISAASAQTTIRITGSTAFRAAVYQAIQNILAPGYVYGYSGTTLSKASQAIFTGNTSVGSISVIIKTSFSGSVGGISTVAADLTIGPGGTFTGGGGWLVDSTAQSTGGTPNAPAVYDSPVTADVSMADCFQVSAPLKFRTPKLHDTNVGVVTFEWVLTPGKAALGTINTSTNLTSADVTSSLVNKTLLLSSLSGNSGDTELVQAVGRDEDSGTRIQALACSGIGIAQHLKQYQPLYDGATTPLVPPPAPGTQITGAKLWPKVTLNTISYPIGDSGYSGGGSLAAAINVSHSGGRPTYNNWFLTYFGINDAATVTTGTILQFNGTSYSSSAVENGTYTFWGYEHLFYRASFSGNGKTVADQIGSNITSTTASISGILRSAMTVHRTKDGGPILPGGI